MQTTGIKTKYFRFPGGCYDKQDLQIVSQLGLKIIQWDASSGDAFSQDTNAIVERVLAKTQNGSIIVLHLQGGPNAPKTTEALQVFVPRLIKQGYQFVTISQLLTSF